MKQKIIEKRRKEKGKEMKGKDRKIHILKRKWRVNQREKNKEIKLLAESEKNNTN